MRGRYQGGSLAGFIIIGAVLALVLVGSLYGLNRYNAEQSRDVTSDQKNAPDAGSDSKDVKEQPKPEPSKKDDQPNKDNEPESAVNTAPTDAELPATGPADTVAALVAIGALGFATTHYLQSRSRNQR